MNNNPQGAMTLSEVADTLVSIFVCILSKQTNDDVYLYAYEVITLGLVWYGYRDACREGDGDRVLLIWKFLLLIFRVAKRKNYSKEAAILLVQDNFLLTKRQAAQLRYSRFINAHGRQGCNIPCDLFMEHLNRQLKSVIGNMGSSIQPTTIANAARAIGVVHDICSVFEKELKSQEESGYHAKPSY